MTWILQDPARWLQLSSHARQLVEQRFAPEVVVRQYLDVYQTAVTRHAKQLPEH
jgi:glycosyltransferase involved in cell wall biosynthesis